MRRNGYIAIVLLSAAGSAWGQDGAVREAVNAYYESREDGEVWEAGRSSALTEEGYGIRQYEIDKLWDKDLSTAWAEGAEGDGVGEWFLAPVELYVKDLSVIDYADNDNNIDIKLEMKFKICNGFWKSEETLRNNNRVKRARITVYDTPLRYELYEKRGENEIYVKKCDRARVVDSFEIELADSADRDPGPGATSNQEIVFPVDLHSESEADEVGLFIKFEILEVYAGEKYQDTCVSCFAASAVIYSEVREAVNGYYKSQLASSKGKWEAGRSSALTEEGYDIDYYEIGKMWDKDLSTAWAEGTEGDGIGEWFFAYVELHMDSRLLKLFMDSRLREYDYIVNEIDLDLKLDLKIRNGFCKSEETFRNNNRVKKARVTVYVAPLTTAQIGIYVYERETPQAVGCFEIELSDVMEEQRFSFPVDLHISVDERGDHARLFVKFEILEVYAGEKYQDTCVSEFWASAEEADEEK